MKVVAAEPQGGGWLVHTSGPARAYDELLVAVGHQGGSSVFPVDRRLSRATPSLRAPWSRSAASR